MNRLFLLIFMCSLIGCGKEGPALTIAVASNMQPPVRDIVTAYMNKEAVKVDMITGSSGMLTAQLKKGAPYDLFLSADMRYPMSIYESGLADQAPAIYAYGKLVLRVNNEKDISTISDLANPSIQHIAVANPDIAPYGEAAMQVLKNSGSLELIKNKLVYGQNISNVAQFLISGAANAGFVACSARKNPGFSPEGHWIAIEDSLYDPIAQGMVKIKPASAEAKKFYEFMFSGEAQDILVSYGYALNLSR